MKWASFLLWPLKKPFSLDTLLLIIVLAAIVATLLLPSLLSASIRARIASAKVETIAVVAAIKKYDEIYGRLPSPVSRVGGDITFGTAGIEGSSTQRPNVPLQISTNSPVMTAIMNLDWSANSGYAINTNRIIFLEVCMVSDTRSGGVSTVDKQFRDPWGNPYVISLDANGDGLVCDAVYGSAFVSSTGTSGALTNIGGTYQLPGKVMVWSRGPDGKASATVDANSGVNKDNVLSWK